MAPGPCGKPWSAAHETAGELRVRPCLAPQSSVLDYSLLP